VNIDALTGRELDVAVAGRVFGYEVEERANTRTGEKDAVYRMAGTDWVRVPFYSTSLAASIQVELELQKQGWKRQEVRAGSHWNEPGGVRVVLEHADGRTVGAFGHPDEAHCRAALKAVAP
jgi:hypothetical protein